MPKPTRRSMNDFRSRFRGFAVLVMLDLAAASFATSGHAGGVPERQHVAEHLSGVHMPFVANAGQTDSAVVYFAPTFAGTVFVARDGRIVYSLPGRKAVASRDVGTLDVSHRDALRATLRSPDRNVGWTLTETAVHGTPRPSGGDRAATHVSYLIGSDPARWSSALATFESVSLGEVWPGIRLDLQASGKNVEKRFAVAPGGDPSRIRMRVGGARRLRIDASGALVVATGNGDVTFTPPAAFQERSGTRHSIGVAYELHGRREYGFRLGNYDHTLPVLIDPLLQATYLGGGGIDSAFGLAIHPTSGDVYVAGQAASSNFPGTTGGAQAANGGKSDAFVARLNAALTTLEQVTYLGGVEDDLARALAIHPTTGDVYIAGQTLSTDFPGTAGGAQPTNATFSIAAFVAHLSADLKTLHQATYFGGGVTVAYALAIHPATGDVYVAGSETLSVLPGTTGGAQPAGGGGVDGFVARLNSALTTLDQATYLGGSGGDTAYGLAIHPLSGDVYVTGETDSTNFPGTAGGAQAAHGVDFGNSDAFVAHLNSALTSIGQATYLGGNNQEIAQAIAIHPTSGDVYVAGWTQSTNFPGTAGGAQATFAGGAAAFVAHLDSTLTTLDQATYLGVNGNNRALAVAIHPSSGDVYAAGFTTGDFPGTTGGAQSAFGGFQDAFVAHLNPALTALDQATYLGGASADTAQALAIHPASGDVYVAGPTQSTNFPGTAGGAQAAHAVDGTNADAFVARLTPDLAAPGIVSANLGALAVSAGTLSPAFNSSLLAYTDSVPFGVVSITVTPTLADSTATVTVNGNSVSSGTASAPIDLSVGSNPIAIVVTAQDASRKTYSINVIRSAALFRAYLSVRGSDANPCTLPQPCRLLPAALLAIGDGDEIWMLDSANYNTAPVSIAKSVTILAIPGVVGSIVASNGDAIDIDAPGVKVSLRNLVLLNLGGGLSGVNFAQGAELTVEDCEIYGMGNAAISASAANANVAVTNSVIRDNASYGLAVTGALTATLDRLHLLNNSLAGLFVGGNAQVTLSNSVVADNATFGVTAQATAGTTTRVVVEKSVLRANVGSGLEGFADSGGGQAEIALSRSSISHNGTGVSASTNTGGSVTLVLAGDVVTGNGTGIRASGAGTSVVYTRHDNAVSSNATDLSGVTLIGLTGK